MFISVGLSGIEQVRLLPHPRDGDLQAHRVPRQQRLHIMPTDVRLVLYDG